MADLKLLSADEHSAQLIKCYVRDRTYPSPAMNTSPPVTGGTLPAGAAVPPDSPHAVIHSLPTWLDVVEYMDNKDWAINAMKTAYPRVQLHSHVAQSWRDTNYYHVHKPLESGAKARAIIQSLFSGIIGDGPDNIRGVPYVSPDDVYLYSFGMNAIWEAHMMILHTQSKVQKCAALKTGDPDTTSSRMAPSTTWKPSSLSSTRKNPKQPPISALYTDFPSNPLLRSPDLSRLRKLADQYGFPIVIDETVGNFLTVQLLPYADIVTCSLTKVFSGLANVMGGTFLLNPALNTT
ncbi:hypothetical protein IW261DRAFT_1429802, partial [Armillaria novae-zelandiae]